MLRSPLPRVAGFLIAVLVSFASPALALAHGYAHHQAHEHEEHSRQHFHGEGVDASRSSHGQLSTELQAADTGEDHGHPQLSGAVSARVSIPVFRIIVPTTELPVAIVRVATVSLPLTAVLARASPSHARPRQPRAPPLV